MVIKFCINCLGLKYRKGFTLVELLVVIGIIAILAGVALGPITRAMKSAKQNAGMQTSRTLALAEFQYANDNNQNYPDKSTTGSLNAGNATDVAACLLAGGYVSDPSIFWISGSSETKYTGSISSPTSFATSNISWDFAGNTNFQGVNVNAPDTLPLVWSSITASEPTLSGTGPVNVTLSSASAPFGTTGIAVCYKSNSAAFLIAPSSSSVVTLISAAYPGWTGTVLQGGG